MSENHFDTLSKMTHNVVSHSMGYYVCVLGEGDEEGDYVRVLLRDPSRVEKMMDDSYLVNLLVMEYHQGDFPGVFEAVNSGGVVRVKRKETGQIYEILQGASVFDGRTYKVYMQAAQPAP